MLRRIGFSNAVVATITGYQVIKSIDELLFLDDERMTNICRVICCPGGTGSINNNNPGQKISIRYEESLKLFVYYVKQ